MLVEKSLFLPTEEFDTCLDLTLYVEHVVLSQDSIKDPLRYNVVSIIP